MPRTTCSHCGGTLVWYWNDAFDKFGFDDGDGMVMTETVADVLRERGYEVATQPWGWHNVVITSIKKDGKEQIPESATVGYDDPRTYLPVEIIALLDEKLDDNEEIEP